MRNLLLILFLTGICCGLNAQTGRIRGKVTDKGKGLAACEVKLYEGLEEVAKITANAEGEFDFGAVKPGCYEIEAAIGSIKVTQQLCLEAQSTYILNLYDGPPCPCCPARQMVANPSWHGEYPRADLDLN